MEDGMIERLEDMPEGTIGFELSGEVTGQEYRKAWTRVAIVTDSTWPRLSFSLWSHFVPVEMKIFTPAEPARRRVRFTNCAPRSSIL
jgi:hypothetical protein